MCTQKNWFCPRIHLVSHRYQESKTSLQSSDQWVCRFLWLLHSLQDSKQDVCHSTIVLRQLSCQLSLTSPVYLTSLLFLSLVLCEFQLPDVDQIVRKSWLRWLHSALSVPPFSLSPAPLGTHMARQELSSAKQTRPWLADNLLPFLYLLICLM